MKFGNRKGFTGIEVIVLVALISVAAWFAGPPLVKSAGTLLNGGDKNQQKSIKKVDKTRNYFELDEKTGKYKLAYVDKTSEYSNELDAQQPPETLWQKFMKLGVMAIVIIVVLSYLGLWPIIALWWNKLIKPKIDKIKADLESAEEAKTELRGDAKLIVISVDEGLAAMNTAIASADNAYDIASKTLASAGLTVDAVQRTAAIANAQLSLNMADAVLTAVTNMKKDFLSAMSRKQDTTTKLLVAELKND